MRKAGAARRSIRTPNRTSPSWRRYQWWVAETGYIAKQENFCHYWRVALILAPLRKLALMLARLVQPTLISCGLLATATCGYGVYRFFENPAGFWHKLGGVVLILVGIGWVFVGAVAGVLVSVEFIPDPTAPPAQPWPRKEKVQLTTAALVTLPVCLVVSLLMALIAGLAWAHDKRIASRSVVWLLTARTKRIKGLGWFRPAYLLPAALVGLSFEYHWARKFLYTVLFVCAFVVLAVLGGYLSDKHKERRIAFAETQQDSFKDEPPVYPQVTYYTPPRQSWLRRRTRAVGGRLLDVGEVVTDFLALFWTALVVQKWGICPIMELPQINQPEGDTRNSGAMQA